MSFPGTAPRAGEDGNGSAVKADVAAAQHKQMEGDDLQTADPDLKAARIRITQTQSEANAKEKPSKSITLQKDNKAVFVDAAAMKEKVRQNLTKRKHTVSDYYKTTGLFQQIARATLFEHITLGVIAFNALWIAIDTDHNGSEMLLDAHPVFQIAENGFCMFFSFEWVVRFSSFRRKRDGLKDAWFVFDSMLVLTMVLETWALNAFAMVSSGGGQGGMGNASILRIARLLRLSRMARMARLLRAMPELMVLIKGMMAATRSVFFTLCLLILIMYVFAIAFTQLCAETEIGKLYFNRVPDAMYTLLCHGALLDNVTDFATELGSESFFIAAIFFVFSLLAALTVMNMLIGVLCEVVSAVAATEKEEMLVGYVNGKLRQVVDLLDTDGDLKISKKEFVEILENIDAARALQEVGVDVIGLIDFAEFIFQDDNEVEAGEEQEKELSFTDFMEVVLQLRGSNNATVKDIVDLRKFIRRALIQTNSQLANMQKLFRASSRMSNAAGDASGSNTLSVLDNGVEKLPGTYHAMEEVVKLPQDGSTVPLAVTLGNAQATNPCGSAEQQQHGTIVNIGIRIPQRTFGGVEDGGYPVPPLPTPPATLLHHRVQENERLLWGEQRARHQDAIALQGHWQPFEPSVPDEAQSYAPGRTAQGYWQNPMHKAAGWQYAARNGTKEEDANRELSDPAQWSELTPSIEVEELRGQMARLGKVLSAGMSEFNKIREALDREAAR